MRVEAELARDSVHEAAREEPVEGRPGRERTVEQGLVVGRVRGRDERLGAPDRAENGGVDARRRCEAGTRHPPHEAQLVPRSPHAAQHGRRPDRRPLRGQAPLHDRVELRQRNARVPEEPAKDRGAGRERQIRDDGERLVRQRHHRRVSRHDLDPRMPVEAPAKVPQRGRVQFDRADPGARVGERARKDAAAGTEVENERAGVDAGVADELVGEGATTKCVAAAGPRLR